MLKYFSYPKLCLCVFLSVPALCSAQTYPRDWWNLKPTWDWGTINDDIPCPKFPSPLSGTESYAPDMTDVVVLKDSDLSGRDFRNVRCHLMGARFVGVNFDKTNFEGADFSETFFIGCSFRGANLRYAKIRFSSDCDLTDTILGGEMEGLTAKQIQSTWNFKNKDFSNIRFIGGAFPDIKYDSSFNFANSGSDGGTAFPVDKFIFDDCEWNRLPLGFFPSHPVVDGSQGWWS